jgi:hypothetical protein
MEWLSVINEDKFSLFALFYNALVRESKSKRCREFSPESPKSFLDTVSTGSDSDLVNDRNQEPLEYRMLIIDQVAIAPCTSPTSRL